VVELSTEGYGRGFAGKVILYLYDPSTDKYYPVSGEIVGNKIILHIIISDSKIMSPSDIQAVYKPSGTTLYSGTVTASGNSSSIDVSTVSHIRVMAKVTSVSGTNPTLDIYIEGLYEATNDWVPLLSKTGINATGIYELGQLDGLCFRYIRVRWVVGGTSPSFTFGVYAQMLVL
jgi:hypothetical protein